ncbi:MAG: hypothetical protein ACRDOK_24525, partial [Streptosporangiaceae bacterium]
MPVRRKAARNRGRWLDLRWPPRSKRAAQREAAAQRAARALVEYPVVYYAQADPEIAGGLRTPWPG